MEGSSSDEFPAEVSDNATTNATTPATRTAVAASGEEESAASDVVPETTDTTDAPTTLNVIGPLEEATTSTLEGTAAALNVSPTIATTTTATEATSSTDPSTPEPTTPTATATATATSTPSAHPILRGQDALLREWNMAPASPTATAEATATMMPPVAPAVVLNETSEGSTNSLTPRVYSYPVATFVSNFVRTTVNEVRDHMANHIYAAAVPEAVDEAAITSSSNDPTSIRSEPAGMVAAEATATSHAPFSRSLNSSRSNPSLEDEEGAQEFLLIDGDLVAIPAMPHHSSSTTMEDESDVLSRRHSFQPFHSRSHHYNNNNNLMTSLWPQNISTAAHSQAEGSNSNDHYLLDHHHSEDFLLPRHTTSQSQFQNNISSQDSPSHQHHPQPLTGSSSERTSSSKQSRYERHGHGGGRSVLGEDDDSASGEHHPSQFTQSMGSLTPNSCRPNHSRMHRGMRKVKKWMKKKNLLPRRSMWKHHHHQQRPDAKHLEPDHIGPHTVMGNRRKGDMSIASSTVGEEEHSVSRDDSSIATSSMQAPASISIPQHQPHLHQHHHQQQQLLPPPLQPHASLPPTALDDDSIATSTFADDNQSSSTASPSRNFLKRNKKKKLGRLKKDTYDGSGSTPPAPSSRKQIATTGSRQSLLQQQQQQQSHETLQSMISGESMGMDSGPMDVPAMASPLHAPPTAAAAASFEGVASWDPRYSTPASASAMTTMGVLEGPPPPPPDTGASQGMTSLDPLSSLSAAAATAAAGVPHDLSSPYAMASAASFPTATAEASASLLDGSTHEMPSLNGSTSSFHRQASVAAEYMGNADQLMQAGVLPESVLAAEAYIEDRLDDYDKYDKKESYHLRSMVPGDADFKVDKLDAPCVDMMLRRAGEIAEDNDGLEYAVAEAHSFLGATKGKSNGESVPLSMATGLDTIVHNDILKLVMVGDARVDKSALARALRKSSKKPRKRTTLGVDVHSWTPPNHDDVRFTIWDVQGAASTEAYDSNFGAHPGTQSLFFSDRSLYLLVWDLAATNHKSYRRKVLLQDEDSDDEDEEDENEYLREEANRQADRALQADIEERVLSWMDCIARRGSHSAILPIALVDSQMAPDEAKRRCDTMQTMMMQHTLKLEQEEGVEAPKVLSGAETILCVSLDTNMGMQLLEETILAIATDASHSVFDHVGTPVPFGTTQVLETCRRLKHDHKLVLVDHLMTELMPLKGEMGLMLTVEQVMESLHFLACIGEVLYFGGMDDILNHYVILSRKWMVSALSCILRNDLKRELMETRRFMNMQCLYSDQQFPENHVTQTFSANTSNCPLLSSTDTQMLWQSMSFMREAADKSSQNEDNSSTTNSTMFGFLEHLLVHTGVFLPLDIDRFASPDMVYFVPSLLAQDTHRDVWTYKSSDSWMTTLAHSWLFRDGTPSGLMEHVTVALLRDLYEFSHIVAARPHTPPPRSQTFPFNQNSMDDFLNNHEGDLIGHIKIHQMMCWKNSLLVKIGCVFPDGNELRESFAEIFVSIADPSSNHCVSSDAMRTNMQRLIVSGKGQVGHHGRKLWKGGYSLVLDSIKASVASCTNVDRQVVCPECLAHSHPSSASTWSWDSVRAAAETGSTIVRCMRGHRVDTNLICGTVKAPGPKNDGLHSLTEAPKKPVKDMLPAVVLVGLWDCKTNTVRNVGSGFIVDKKQGLIVTAGHILFEMEEGRNFGTPYFGLKHAKVVIGTVPESSKAEDAVANSNNNNGTKNNNNTASFRYFAEIVADDIHSMDACVLRITTRLEQDVDDEALLADQPENVINLQEVQLPVLKMTRKFELEESVRILGFNQAGEGWLEQGKHVNRSADFARGYICKQFKIADDGSESDSDDSSSSGGGFSPREEIVIMCPTIPGHSGGPCVNEEGRVVGILSRADPVDRNRCYLVPSSELKILVNKAKKSSARVGGPKAIY